MDKVNELKLLEKSDKIIGQKKFIWQENCIRNIEDKSNVLLVSPTGSGKTIVFLKWALKKKERPIFITAPIKSLSNQRYRHLSKLGYSVGIETGDIKNIQGDNEFICCTQEIYTNKYINKKNTTLIIDEFHYIFENQDRARTYIDTLKNSKSKNLFICSATLGNLAKAKEYLAKISNRDFYLYENSERLTELIYNGKIGKKAIQNALVVTFSANNCFDIANKLAGSRNKKERLIPSYQSKNINNFEIIKELYSHYNINNLKLKSCMRHGIGVYYGNLLPKEKIFIEELFEKRLIETIVGTNALYLGLNFPVKNVVFTQLAKYYDGVISKNLFEQISGRAGRKGYFNKGYVYYCDDFNVENNYFNTKTLYKQLLEKENESIKIIITPLISKILKGTTTIQNEVKYISENSTEPVNTNQITNFINSKIQYINTYKTKNDIQEEFKQNISYVYFDEYDSELNCYLFSCILENKSLEEIIQQNYAQFKDFNSLLQLRKYLKSLPKQYRKKSYIIDIEKMINDIDNSVLSMKFLEKDK